jgi:hypothetical protein
LISLPVAIYTAAAYQVQKSTRAGGVCGAHIKIGRLEELTVLGALEYGQN